MTARDGNHRGISRDGAGGCTDSDCWCYSSYSSSIPAFMQDTSRQALSGSAGQINTANPKTLTGNLKVPNLSVIPFTALIHEARAMQYGAYHAPRTDGKKGYGPFNWRDQKIEYLTYAEAALRHIASAVDREDIDPDTGELKVLHLALARATLGILIDAIEHDMVIDNRSPTARGRVAELLRQLRTPL